MKVYKFGGASVKDANGVRNLHKVMLQIDNKNVILVVSAMGKMTNAFEKILNSYVNNLNDLKDNIEAVVQFHNTILVDLFKNKSHEIYQNINQLFIGLSGFLIQNKHKDYNYIYDQIVSIAELISTQIVSAYLNDNQINNQFLDVRDYIKTNSDFREAIVDWKQTEHQIKTLKNNQLFVTQGFIARDNFGHTTTLGREGSDYTAAIFAYCLNAENVTIFKDVPGVLNADPRVFNKTKLLKKISYEEAIEMAFYGASVIHPKTLQPIRKKEIPLYVKSFLNPKKNGTCVEKGIALKPKTPCYVVKNNQILISIATKDFSFIMENNISEIFELLHKYKLNVNLIQNTAISFFVCIDDKFNNFVTFINKLESKYNSNYYDNVSLLTVRHFTKKTIKKIEAKHEVILRQTSIETVQFVVKT
jgi:aspartate kinase